jgi:hypothetical protein
MTPLDLWGGLLFGSLGLFAVLVGKKQEKWAVMGLGLALMFGTYLFSGVLLWVFCALLSVGLMAVWRQS